MKLNKKCIGCKHLMREYDDDRRSWYACDMGYRPDTDDVCDDEKTDEL